MTTLTDLIERLEKAEKGSRELDIEIFREGVIPGQDLFRCAGEGFEVNVSHFIPGRDPDWRWQPSGEIAPYTTSLDAALTLVGDSGALVINRAFHPDMGGKQWSAAVNYHRGHSFTHALALCIAALKARAS